MDLKELQEKFVGKKYFEGNMAPRDMMVFYILRYNIISNQRQNYFAYIFKSFISSDVEACSKDFRILGPDSMMTMDYREERINITLDENRICTRVFMG